jgi:hypothetical protein
MNGLQELKELYKQAVEENKESFIFQDQEVLTNYAKYLIEYMEDYYSKRPNYCSKN